MLSDLRHAIRSLLKSPGFTATALATLAVCLGANLVIYAVVNGILLRPLPFPEPGQLVTLNNGYPKAGDNLSTSSTPNYFERRGAIPAFAALSQWGDSTIIVGGRGSPDRVAMARVTPDFFDTLGVKLARGKMFADENLTYQTDLVAVITDEFWRSYFAGDPGVIGQTFLNDNLPVTVIGVLPPGFRFLSSPAKFFRPASHDPGTRVPRFRHSNNLNMIARLAPGLSLIEAQARMDAFNALKLTDDPQAELVKNAGFHTRVRSLHAEVVREIRPVLLLLQAGVVFLLLIGLGNLVNLLLIRASARTKEIAVRQALGAGPGALARGVLAETALLSLAGGGLGLLVAAFGLELLAYLGADRLPLGATVALDAPVVLTGLAATLLTGVLIAGPVIWFHRQTSLAHGLQAESRGGTAGRTALRVRQGFIVAQVALAFLLLAGAGLLGLSLKKALSVPTGFQAGSVLTGQLALPWKGYPTDEARGNFVHRLLPALRTLPGVTHAAFSTGLPFATGVNNNAVAVEGRTLAPGETIVVHYTSLASAEYWPAMGIPLLRGRLFTDADFESAQNVCLVDQAFADRYWPGQDPVGRRLAGGTDFTEDQASTIVGVVAPIKQSRLTEADGHGAVYFAPKRTQIVPVGFTLVVRADLPPESLAASVRKAVLALDSGLPVENLKSMQAIVDESLTSRRSPAILAGIFAGTALLLAGLGLYGVMAFAVAQRIREFGIRLALGAAARDVLGLVVREGARLALLGLVVGLAASLLLTRFMASMLYGVQAHDPVIYVSVAVVLALVALTACLLPARRATKVDPMVALRAE